MRTQQFKNDLVHTYSRRADRCSFHTFWVGYADWWAERLTPGASSTEDKPAPPKVVRVLLLAGLVLAAPVLAATFAPLAAGTMSAMGTRAVAAAAQVGAVAVGLGFLIGLPVWAGWRTMRFCKAMCLRGHDILAGRRARVRLL